jgi:hypothetical protein
VSFTLAAEPRLIADHDSFSSPQVVSYTSTEVSLAGYSPMSLSPRASSITDKGSIIASLRRGLLGLC